MIWSCSAWIVATMSRIPSPRGALTAASSAASRALRARRAAEDLVGEIEHLTPEGVELAAATHVLRVRGGGDVERARRRRPPIEQQRFVLVVFVEQADPADVGRFAGNGVQPTETQPVVRHVQPPQLSGHRAHLGIAIHERPAVLEVDGGPQRRAVPPLRSRALGVEPRVEPRHVAPFGPQFVVVRSAWHRPSLSPLRTSTRSVERHRALDRLMMLWCKFLR